ncbi:MAG: metallophosphoesterase family protein, partial [Myxococcota bacterium]
GQRVLMAHGTPGNQVGYVTPESIPKAFRRRLRTLDADVLILGHTHIPMCLEIGHVTIVNPGSVCNLRPRDSHTCAILYLPERRLEVLEL